MTIDIAAYEINKKFIQNYYRHHGGDPLRIIGILSAVTFCPVLATTFFMGEEIGWSEEIIHNIKSIIKFYKYDVILNIPESFPKDII